MQENEESLTAVEELQLIVAEELSGNNELRMFLTDKGLQRVEIEDLDDKLIWFELELTEIPENYNSEDFEEICEAVIEILDEILEQEVAEEIDRKAQLN